MSLSDYISRAAAAWFLGFFPLAEIYVAVPAAIASGLDDVSVIVWTVFGNFTPAILINALYQWLRNIDRIDRWFTRMTSARMQRWLDRYGMWIVLFITPWIGIWATTVTAKVFGMNTARFLVSAFASIMLYALAILFTVRTGADML
jgi:uncharacterized membrane protein